MFFFFFLFLHGENYVLQIMYTAISYIIHSACTRPRKNNESNILQNK